MAHTDVYFVTGLVQIWENQVIVCEQAFFHR